MKFHVVTLFPEMFAGILTQGVIGRGVESGLLEVVLHNPRDFAHDRHRTVDDSPYGGGAGMVVTSTGSVAAPPPPDGSVAGSAPGRLQDAVISRRKRIAAPRRK